MRVPKLRRKTVDEREAVAKFIRGCLRSVGASVPPERILEWTDSEREEALVFADEMHAWIDEQIAEMPKPPAFVERARVLGGSMLPFPWAEIEPGGERTLSVVPQGYFQPLRLSIPRIVADAIIVRQILVGVLPVGNLGVDGLPGSLFADDVPFDRVLQFPLVLMSQQVSIVIYNRAAFIVQAQPVLEGIHVPSFTASVLNAPRTATATGSDPRVSWMPFIPKT